MTHFPFTMSQNGNNSYCFDDNMQQMKFNLKKSVQVCKILIHTDKRLIKNDVIFTMIDIDGQRQSFLSPTSGTVTQLYIHELDILSYDSIILEYEECRHTVTSKNLCGDCGIVLNQRKNALSVSNSSKVAIRMEPSFPQVTITREAASRYDNEERNHLLSKRKLHLLVDLYQTLVHTTNIRDHYPFSPEVIAYQLNNLTFYTKLRSGVKEFLTNLRSLYQFHIVTFGDRPYANTIAKIIDPDEAFFSHRILSRDECLSLTDKTANLSSLFPCGDSLVCIIDGREDA
jgi:RNA polymerase II subunit A-like phosphatase